MKDEKILEVCGRYHKILDKDGIIVFRHNYVDLDHIRWMLAKIEEFLVEDRKEKANRWLGFIQGVLWSKGICTIDELKGHNKDEKKNL